MTAGEGIHVLVVDDVEMIREAVGALLALYPAVREVTYADDGEVAVEQVAANPPDVVLMDLRMPRLDGLAASRIIRSRFPQVAIVIHSAYEQEAMIAEAEDLEVSYFIKGSPVRALVATLEAAVAAHRA